MSQPDFTKQGIINLAAFPIAIVSGITAFQALRGSTPSWLAYLMGPVVAVAAVFVIVGLGRILTRERKP